MFTAARPDPNAVESLYLQKPIEDRCTLQVACCLTSQSGQTPYFSVTGTIRDPRCRDGIASIGAIHEDILKHYPELAPLVALHLSTKDGVPMHAVENGFYWAGGTEWNGSGPKDPPNASILANHLRIPEEEAKRLVDEVTAKVTDKPSFTAFCEAQKPRWAAEAEAGIATIRAGGPAPSPQAGLTA